MESDADPGTGQGLIIAGTNICVDYWLPTKQKYLHFLSHLSSGHSHQAMPGFSDHIYTSPVNAVLLIKWFKMCPERLVELELGEPYALVDHLGRSFSVTPIDANHCPGSVMFYFEGAFGNILYTGAFRYSPTIMQNPVLKRIRHGKRLDQLYLDNTFSAERCIFPPREELLVDILEEIRIHPDHYVLIGVGRLGKEEVLKAIAQDLQEKVLVSQEREEVLELLGYQNTLSFTLDANQSRILVQDLHQISVSYIRNLMAERGPVLALLLTARRPAQWLELGRLRSVTVVPYSDHSNHAELCAFVSQLRPCSIFPIVGTQGSSGSSIIPPSIMELAQNKVTSQCSGSRPMVQTVTAAEVHVSPGILRVGHEKNMKLFDRIISAGRGMKRKAISLQCDDVDAILPCNQRVEDGKALPQATGPTLSNSYPQNICRNLVNKNVKHNHNKENSAIGSDFNKITGISRDPSEQGLVKRLRACNQRQAPNSQGDSQSSGKGACPSVKKKVRFADNVFENEKQRSPDVDKGTTKVECRCFGLAKVMFNQRRQARPTLSHQAKMAVWNHIDWESIMPPMEDL